ncbi:MAG: zinc ABC transporter solute-binding protein [Gammaproteobacteria bacterium]|nr:zinc ABC transporter solute-binding protein [Gammaproteobacteria bacterium]
MKMRTVIILAILLSLIGSACGNSAVDDRPTVVTTTTILGDIVREIVGDELNVQVLMPVGVDPHEFSASAGQVAQMESAVLVVANGLGLEEGLSSVLDAVMADGVPVLRVGDVVTPRYFENGQPDPHIWFDPERMAVAVRKIAERLAEVDDRLSPADWSSRGDAYAARILDTEAEMKQRFGQISPERRKLVTSHMAFGYLADRFGFEVVGVVIPGGGTLGEASASALGALAETIVAEDVPAIFVETTVSPRLSETLAAETGRDVEIVTLYTGSLGAPGSGADTYLGLLLTDTERIVDALKEG